MEREPCGCERCRAGRHEGAWSIFCSFLGGAAMVFVFLLAFWGASEILDWMAR
jgi:hypothetical protein